MNFFPLILFFSPSAAAHEPQSAPPASSAVLSTGPLELSSLLEQARAKNPAIRAARARWRSLEGLVLPARTWKDPVLGVTGQNMPADSERSMKIMVEQDIPFPGKLSAESRMKEHEALIAKEEWRAKEREVLAEVRIHYYRLLWLDRTAAALRRDADILRAVARVAQTQVAAGKTGAEEAFLAAARLKQVENSAFEREVERVNDVEDLNAHLADPAGTPRGRVSEAEVDLPDLGEPIEVLAEAARAHNPDYLSTLHMVHHSDLGIGRGRLAFAPDFKISAGAETFRRRSSEGMLGFSLSLPVWFRRPAGELAAAKAHGEHSRAEAESMRGMVLKDLYVEYSQVKLHRSVALSTRSEILPLAEAAVRIAIKNYEGGRSDFTGLSEAVRTLLEAQMKYYEAVYHYGEHWAMLERIIGRELETEKRQ